MYDPLIDPYLFALAGGQPAGAFPGDTINALQQGAPRAPSPQTVALLSVLGAQRPTEQASPPPSMPTLDEMPGGVTTAPTPAASGSAPWGFMTPEQGRKEIEERLPGLQAQTAERQRQLDIAKAAGAPVSLWGTPVYEEGLAAPEARLKEAQKAEEHAQAQLSGEAPLPEITPERNVAETFSRSAVQSLSDVPRFAGYIGGWLAQEAGSGVEPTSNAVYRLGQNVHDWAKTSFPGDPERSEEFGTKAANLTGFLATLYGTGGVRAMAEGGPALAEKIGEAAAWGSQAALAASSGGMAQFEGATAAMNQGADVTERDRAMATLLGAGVGLTGLIPIASALATPAEKSAGEIMAHALQGSGVTAGQMAAFNVLNNAIAKNIYDPSRSLTQGLGEDVGLGALLGGVTHGVSAASAPKRLSTPEEIRDFIEAARARSGDSSDPAKAAYWSAMHDWARSNVPRLPAPEGAAAPQPEQQPLDLATANAPYAVRGTKGGVNVGSATPPEAGGEVQPGGAPAPVEGGPQERANLPAARGAGASPRRVVGTETFGYEDRNGAPVVGTVNNERPSGGMMGKLVFRAYPEDSQIARNQSPEKTLGKPMASVSMVQHPNGEWEVGMMETLPGNEGRQLTGRMLDQIEERLGKLRAPGTFWPQGYSLWQKRDPEAIQNHREVQGEWLSPAMMQKHLDANNAMIESLDEVNDWEFIQDLRKENKEIQKQLESVPEEARTPEALAAPFALRGFYRPDVRAVEEAKQPKATAQQWIAAASKAPGAARWLALTGFEDWANAQKGSISKEDVLDFMRAHDVEMEEKQLSGVGKDELERARSEIAMDRYGRDYPFLALDQAMIVNSMAQQQLNRAGSVTKYGEYKIPGGKRYREFLIKLPSLEEKWISPHFRENEVIHMRMDDRTLPDGSKTLFLNEIQSDLHQRGREHGYATQEDIDNIEVEAKKIYEKKIEEFKRDLEEYDKRMEEIIPISNRYYELLKEIDLEAGQKTVVKSKLMNEGYTPQTVKGGIEWLLNRGDTLPPAFIPLHDELVRKIDPDKINEFKSLRVKLDILSDKTAYAPKEPDIDEIRRKIEERYDEMAPDAPFKGDWWWEIGLKKLIHKAADEGYDAIAIPNSGQIEKSVGADEGSLSVFYDQKIPRFLKKYAIKLGGQVDNSNIPGILNNHASFLRVENRIEVPESTTHFMRRNGYDPEKAIKMITDLSKSYPHEADRYGKIIESIRMVADEMAKEEDKSSNTIIRITPKMRDAVLGPGQALAKAPARVMEEMDADLQAGKPVSIPESTTAAVHKAVEPLRHIVPEDTGVHALAKIEPQGGRLLATFTDSAGEPYQLLADSFADLSDLRGLCAEDGGKILIANFGSGKLPEEARPTAPGQIRTGDAQGGVLVHEGVHSLVRRGLIPAGDLDRLASHAESLGVLDIPIGQYLSAIGEEINVGGDLPLRDVYENVYAGMDHNKRRDLIDKEEAVAHLMELIHHGYFSKDQIKEISGPVKSFMSGAYARQEGGFRESDLIDVQDDLSVKIEGLYDKEFPNLNFEDWETKGWDRLSGKNKDFKSTQVIDRIEKLWPEEVAQYRSLSKG